MSQLVVCTSEEYWLLLRHGNSRTVHTTQAALRSSTQYSSDWIILVPYIHVDVGIVILQNYAKCYYFQRIIQSQGQMPKKKKSHEENLKTVCCVCGRKGNKFKNVTHDLAEKVVKHFHPSYDRHGGIHPTAICSTCHNACIKMEEER